MSLSSFGLRVPLAIAGRNLKKGLVSRARVSQIDLMPTLLDLLDLTPPELQHGVSLEPILVEGRREGGHEFVFSEIAHVRYASDTGMQERSVFDGRYHLIFREGTDRRRIVPPDLREWEKWRNRSYAETIRVRERFPMPYKLLTEIDNGRLGGRPPRFELYDTRADPDELTNLWRDPSHQATLRRLRDGLQAWVRETSDPYVEARDMERLH